jgi:hypothetical protein
MYMSFRVKLLAAGLAMGALVSVQTAGAQQNKASETTTWSGKLSDSMCGADHKANGGTVEKDHKCTLDCVKGHGSEYIFVNNADKKIYKIGNQKFAALEVHAGHAVELTGTLQGDTITVTKVAMPANK